MSNWLVERMFRVMGLDAVFPGAVPPLLEMGFSYTDLLDVVGSSDAMALMPHEWLRKGRFHEAAARKAEESGFQVTAAETYHRAALAYARARWALRGGTPEMASAYGRLTDCFDAACRLLPAERGRVSRFSVDLGEGREMTCMLHLPPTTSGPGPWPVALVYPGMDMAKEYFPNLLANPFAQRGLAVLVLDPPGHGESLAGGLLLTARNVEEAGKRAIDALAAHPELDESRVAVYGVSVGSYFALSHAAEDPRVAAAVAYQGGVFYDKRAFLAAMPPTFTSRLQAMSGLPAGPEFDELAQQLSLEGREGAIACPTLVMTGEWDEVGSLDSSLRLHERLAGPASLLIYEGQGRLMGGVVREATAAALDWLAAALDGRAPAPELRRVPSWHRGESGGGPKGLDVGDPEFVVFHQEERCSD